FMGTMLDIKPLLAMGKNGKIVPAEKVQGRKKALRTLADRTKEWIRNPQEQTIIIMHADALNDAKKLEELILERIPEVGGIEVIFVGPVIGSHCGPGTVASCFMGIERKF
ncbi:MAG: fatty acid-binding protein DegV, partial [Clostridiales bacterium]|nr:fatty acid-binding protein DegV [Clostridiales bacterium]